MNNNEFVETFFNGISDTLFDLTSVRIRATGYKLFIDGNVDRYSKELYQTIKELYQAVKSVAIDSDGDERLCRNLIQAFKKSLAMANDQQVEASSLNSFDSENVCRPDNMHNYSGVVIPVSNIAYDAACGIEAFSRAGYSKNLKGNIQEVAFKNKYNSCPKRILDGTRASLSKSTTAVRDDIVIKNKAGQIIKRYQIKDAISDSGIREIIKEVNEGHYIGTNLVGSSETKVLYDQFVEKMAAKGLKISQRMESTGISSATTSRIAAETIGNKAACSIPKGTVGKLASSSAVAGGALSGGIEVVSSGVRLMNGEIDGQEFVSNVAKETAGGAISSAVASTAGYAATTAVATVCTTVGAPVAVPFIVGAGVCIGVGCAVKSVFDFFFY